MSANCARVRRTRSRAFSRTDLSCEPASTTDCVAPREPLVHEHAILAAAEVRHGAELEVRVVVREVVLARQVYLLRAEPERAGNLVQIDPLGSREHRAHIPAGGDQDECFRHLLRPDAERGGFVCRPFRTRVLENVGSIPASSTKRVTSAIRAQQPPVVPDVDARAAPLQHA
jgi:hypothetical protein